MKLLIFILSYNAERHIESVFEDIPISYSNSANTQILLIDDASQDRTVELARTYVTRTGLKNVRIFRNPINQGYGGNQKVGYTYAIREGFDVVVMLHGDNQYTPRALPELLQPFDADPGVDCVLGVRFGRRYSPLRGGMPAYKYVGNRILTAMQNRLAGVRFGEWHTGYRAYATRALAATGFTLNSNDFHFDTDILLQLINRGSRFVEVNIPTRYGDEICHVNGLRYAKNVIKASVRFMLQKYHLFYDVRYHPEIVFNLPAYPAIHPQYQPQTELRGPQRLVCRDPELIPTGSNVLDIGCGTGQVAEELRRTRSCHVTGVDLLPPSEATSRMERYERLDLDSQPHRVASMAKEGDFDVILMIDVLEHLSVPERVLVQLSSLPYKRPPRFICSTANVAFIVVRLMLCLGHFNYGQGGILEVNHKRLFSVHTLRNLLEQTGFVVQREMFLPFPFSRLGFSPLLARVLERANMLLIKLRPRLFAYEIVVEAVALATPASTLEETMRSESHLSAIIQ